MIYTVLGTLIGGMFLLIIAFLFLCMNTFTIPTYLLFWLVCKLFRLRTPKIAFYSLMLYPSWKSGKRASFMEHVNQYLERSTRKSLRKAARYRPIRAWEERFF